MQLLQEMVIQNKKYILRIIDSDVIHILYLKDSVLDVQDMKEVREGIKVISASKFSDFKTLIELEKFVSITHEAKKYAAKHSPEAVAQAYVIDGLSQRILVKFYIKMRRIDKPTKVFESCAEAMKWLNSFKKKNSTNS